MHAFIHLMLEPNEKNVSNSYSNFTNNQTSKKTTQLVPISVQVE